MFITVCSVCTEEFLIFIIVTTLIQSRALHVILIPNGIWPSFPELFLTTSRVCSPCISSAQNLCWRLYTVLKWWARTSVAELGDSRHRSDSSYAHLDQMLAQESLNLILFSLQNRTALQKEMKNKLYFQLQHIKSLGVITLSFTRRKICTYWKPMTFLGHKIEIKDFNMRGGEKRTTL